MYKPFTLFVGLRYTRSRKRKKFISFSSLMSIIGLGLGVAMLVIVLSVMNGFEREMQDRLLSVIPHATVHQSGGMLSDWQQLAETVTTHNSVQAVAPYLEFQGMLNSQGVLSPVMISGILPSEHSKVSIIPNDMLAGEFSDLKAKDFGIILGYALAAKLNVDLGDKVTLVLPEAALTPAGVFPRLKRLTIVGLFDSKSNEINSNMAFVHIVDAATLLKIKGQIHGVRLRLDNLFAAPEISQQIQQTLPLGHYVTNWTHTHGSLFKAIKFEKLLIGILLFVIVIVALFNVLSTLVMIVNEKRSDIAILRTLGTSSSEIVRIFMVQGLLIGIVGIFWGALIGVIIALNVPNLLDWLSACCNIQLFDPNVYFISYVPSDVRLSSVAIICGIAFVASFLFTIYPALRAAKIEPAEALRYE